MPSSAYPPLETITDDNHGPYVIIADYIFMFLTLIFVLVRLAARYRISNYAVRLDDISIVSAAVFLIAQSVCVQLAADTGLGRHRDSLDGPTFEAYSKYNYASQMLLIVAISAAKLSVILLLIGIKPQASVVFASRVLIAIIVVWAFASLLALGLQCSLPRPWNFTPGRCINQAGLYNTIGVINLVTDLAVVILPVLAMIKVQVSQANRWLVISLFALRLLVCVATVVQLAYTSVYLRSSDRTWESVNLGIWTQVMINLSIITACIPSIKHILSNFQTGLTAFTIPDHFEMAPYKPSNGNNASGGGSGSPRTVFRHRRSDPGIEHGASTNRVGPYGKEKSSTKKGTADDEAGSESVKGLTKDNPDSILHTVDFRVDYGPEERTPTPEDH